MSDKSTHDLEVEILKLNGKLDLLNQLVLQQKERLDNSSATGFKAWESFQKMEGEIGGIRVRVDNHEKDQTILTKELADVSKWARDAHTKYDGINTKFLWTLLIAVVLIALKYALTGRFV